LKGFILFVAIASVIVIAGHASLYLSYIHFFQINNVKVARALGILIAILSISFIASSFLVHWNDNILTRMAYYIASVWIGLLLYLFLANVLTWFIAGINAIFGIGINIRSIAAALVIVSFLYTAYGIFNAAHPRLRNIDVSIKNLPSSWKGRKAIQISDIHLGIINGRQFMQGIVDKINTVNPDIIFITGDLFDGIGDNLSNISEPLKELKPPLGTYFITGNHETYIHINRALGALADKPIKILRNEIVNVDGVELVGIDFPTMSEHLNIDAILSRIDTTKPNIVLFHSPVAIDKFKASGVNLQLAGHTHRGQLWPLNYITHKVYGGYDYGLTNEGDYTLYVTPGTGIWGPPIRTGNRPEITVLTFK
jgi:hypothetical protein